MSSSEWLHVEIDAARNAGTNRKPRIEAQFIDLEGLPTEIPEGTRFMDCNLAIFRVGKTVDGWTRVKRDEHVALKRGPGRGPYKIIR